MASLLPSQVTLIFYPPTYSLSIDMYTATLTSTVCNGVPTRTGSTTNTYSLTIGSLEAGIQYSVSVTGRNTNLNLAATSIDTLTTSEAGIKVRIVFYSICCYT